MLGDVETLELLFLGNADAGGGPKQREDDEAGAEGPDEDRAHADDLGNELGQAAAVEQAGDAAEIGAGQQADHEGAEGAADAVHGDGADGIVDLEDLVDEFDGDDDEDAGTQADDDRAHGRDVGAAGGDGHEAGQNAVKGHGHVGFSVFYPGDDHGRERGGATGQVGGDGDEADVARGGGGGAGVESEPAEPEDEDAKRHEGQVVPEDGARDAVGGVLADARADEPAKSIMGASSLDSQPPPQIQ